MPSDMDPLKMFQSMKMPMMPDMETLLGTYRKNIEVLSAANRVALEGAQAVARRHMEMMQQTMAELTETIQTLGSPDAPHTKAAKQADLLKRAYERAVTNTRELSELIQQSNGEALGMLNGRVSEAMDEMTLLISQNSKG